MNILISAYSINPYNGSEDGIGWNWVMQHEKNYKDGDRIILITKKFNEEDTRKGFEEFSINNIELVIVDVPNYLNWFREKYSIFHHMYYILWQHWAYKYVKNSGIKFDIIHHVTMNDYRITGELYKIKDAKKIWGPVGGAQVTPKALKIYEKNRIYASFREFINKTRTIDPFYRRKVKLFDLIYCINSETQEQISKIIGKKCPHLPEMALKDKFRNLEITKKNSDKVKILFVGRLIEKKGVLLLIDVIKKIPNDVDYELNIYGEGPLEERLNQLINKYNLSQKVFLKGSLSYNEISLAYQDADIFIMPSLRETSGNVLIEAMAHSLPIISFNSSYCKILNDIHCGIFINTNQDLEDIKDEMANKIKLLINDSNKRLELGINGYKYVNKNLTWDYKYRKIYEHDLNRII